MVEAIGMMIAIPVVVLVWVAMITVCCLAWRDLFRD
jgi:hypothetical protein